MKRTRDFKLCICAILVISVLTHYVLTGDLLPGSSLGISKRLQNKMSPRVRMDTEPPRNSTARAAHGKDTAGASPHTVQSGHTVQSALSSLPPHPTVSTDSPSHRCAPIPLKFPVTAPLLPCAWLSSVPPRCSQRLRARLVCEPTSVRMVFEWVSVATPPAAYGFEDPCLARAVRALCFQDGQDLIPNLSHHVLFGGHEIRSYTFIGILSSVRFLQPCMVMIHADVLPVGSFWDTLVRLIPHLIHVQRSAPSVIFGHPVKVIQHSSDIARLEAVKKFGGVYQDTDYILLNPVEDLRNYSVVMGVTIPNVNYCNCIFMGKPAADFLNVWYDSYRTFDDKAWGNHSTMMPYQIHQERPELGFHEVNTFVTPYFKNMSEQFYENFLDWKRLHGIHLYNRGHSKYLKGRLDQQNSSLGQVSRHVLFGDSQACFQNIPLSRKTVRMNSTYLVP
ncbi:uncharacterized protein LOC143285143 [Babylonia areolata]|uniref:uncharacterized protein LOC143285143 n=1 Tax=Babylonia areolata TaxID=304850 RepID=UPI003FD2AFA2